MIWYALGSIKFIWSSETLEGTPHHGIFTDFLMIFFLDSNILEKTKINLVSKYFRIHLSEQLGYWWKDHLVTMQLYRSFSPIKITFYMEAASKNDIQIGTSQKAY